MKMYLELDNLCANSAINLALTQQSLQNKQKPSISIASTPADCFKPFFQPHSFSTYSTNKCIRHWFFWGVGVEWSCPSNGSRKKQIITKQLPAETKKTTNSWASAFDKLMQDRSHFFIFQLNKMISSASDKTTEYIKG